MDRSRRLIASEKKTERAGVVPILVRKGGFEPPRLSAPPPQDGVSASSTTSAHVKQHHRGVFDYSRTNLSRFGAAAYTAGWIHCRLVVLDRTRSISSGVELEGFIHDERGDCGSIGVKVVRAGKGQDRSPHHIEQTEADSGRKQRGRFPLLFNT